MRLRADQFHSQLYDLAQDRSETTDVSSANPSVAAELAQLLERYREGGYSRELPPPPAVKPRAALLQEPVGSVVRRDTLDKLPDAPWVQVRGLWTVRDGALRGSMKGGEQGGAATALPAGIGRGGDRL